MNKKKGFFANLFGSSKSDSCCNMEITEEPKDKGGCCDMEIIEESSENSSKLEKKSQKQQNK